MDDDPGETMETTVSDLCAGATARDLVGGDAVDAERLELATRLYVGAAPDDVPDRRAEANRLHFDAAEIVPDDADSVVDLVATEPVVADHADEVLSASETVAESLTAMGIDPDEPLDRAAAGATRRLAAVEDEYGPDFDVEGEAAERVQQAHQRYFTTLTLYDAWRRTNDDAPAVPDPDAGRAANQTEEVRAVREARREGPTALLLAADDLALDDPPTVGAALTDVLGGLARDVRRVSARSDESRGRDAGR